MKILRTKSNYYIEPLLNPFGFKGSYLTGLWQVIVKVESEQNAALGVSIQSTLWSDGEIFAREGEDGSNKLMYEITIKALELIEGREFDEPFELMEDILGELYEWAKDKTQKPDLRKTFVLNALVAVDNAVWSLYVRERKIRSFDEILPGEHQKKLANIPLITYAMGADKIRGLLFEEMPLLKIKIGSDPEGDNDPKKMLDWDKNRFAEIHKIADEYQTPYTKDGKIHYYLDANGRYQTRAQLEEFLSFAKEIGALDQIELFEEPFSEENKIDVSGLPVLIVADESAHSVEDVMERIQLGYGAIALKPIAKTLSVSLQMLAVCRAKNIPVFCADLTVNPLMVDINKNVAARLLPLPKMNIGAMESNGMQNYAHWEQMGYLHPMGFAHSTWVKKGCYTLDQEFYETNGGIFFDLKKYDEILRFGGRK